MSRLHCPTGRWPARGPEAAISEWWCTDDPRTPDAIPRTGATPCSPPPTSRCAWRRSKREGLTVNPSRIEGGSPSNVVPDLAVLRVNLRPRTPELEADTKRAIDAIIAAVAAEHDVTIEAHGEFGRPPKPLTPEAEALFSLVKRAGADLGQAIDWKPSGGVCDGNNIAACGVPVVDTMGVRGGKIHSMEEFLIVDSLSERAALSALTILRLVGEAA